VLLRLEVRPLNYELLAVAHQAVYAPDRPQVAHTVTPQLHYGVAPNIGAARLRREVMHASLRQHGGEQFRVGGVARLEVAPHGVYHASASVQVHLTRVHHPYPSCYPLVRGASRGRRSPTIPLSPDARAWLEQRH